MKNTFRLWDEHGFNYVFDTDANRDNVVEAIAYVEEHVENYGNLDVTDRLKERGYKVKVHKDAPEENTFYWG